MARKHYSADYRRRLVELVRSGRKASALARQFEPSAKTIREWVREADRAGRAPVDDKDAGNRRLRQEVALLREALHCSSRGGRWAETGSLG